MSRLHRLWLILLVSLGGWSELVFPAISSGVDGPTRAAAGGPDLSPPIPLDHGLRYHDRSVFGRANPIILEGRQGPIVLTNLDHRVLAVRVDAGGKPLDRRETLVAEGLLAGAIATGDDSLAVLVLQYAGLAAPTMVLIRMLADAPFTHGRETILATVSDPEWNDCYGFVRTGGGYLAAWTDRGSSFRERWVLVQPVDEDLEFDPERRLRFIAYRNQFGITTVGDRWFLARKADANSMHFTERNLDNEETASGSFATNAWKIQTLGLADQWLVLMIDSGNVVERRVPRGSGQSNGERVLISRFDGERLSVSLGEHRIFIGGMQSSAGDGYILLDDSGGIVAQGLLGGEGDWAQGSGVNTAWFGGRFHVVATFYIPLPTRPDPLRERQEKDEIQPASCAEWPSLIQYQTLGQDGAPLHPAPTSLDLQSRPQSIVVDASNGFFLCAQQEILGNSCLAMTELSADATLAQSYPIPTGIPDDENGGYGSCGYFSLSPRIGRIGSNLGFLSHFGGSCSGEYGFSWDRLILRVTDPVGGLVWTRSVASPWIEPLTSDRFHEYDFVAHPEPNVVLDVTAHGVRSTTVWRYDLLGNLTGTISVAKDRLPRIPAIAAIQGKTYLAWWEGDSLAPNLVSAWIDGVTGDLDPTFALLDHGQRPTALHVCGGDPYSLAVFALADKGDVRRSNIYAVLLNRRGARVNDEVLFVGGGAALNPELRATWTGREFVIVWIRYDGGRRLFGNRICPEGIVRDGGGFELFHTLHASADVASLEEGVALAFGVEELRRIDSRSDPCPIVSILPDTTEDVPDEDAAPRRLMGNAQPNPTAAGTFVPVTRPYSAGLRLEVFDASGRLVRAIEGSGAVSIRPSWAPPHDEQAIPMGIIWNGCDARGRRVPAGCYVIRVANRERSETRTIVVTR